MPWVKLDDKFHSHPKVLLVGNEGAGMYARALSYCGDHLTDGFIADAWVRTNGGKKLAGLLVEAALWSVAAGGYDIPDFLNIGNKSRAQVQGAREADRVRKESERNPDGTFAESKKSPLHPSPVPSPSPITTGSSLPFQDLDIERRRELDRIWVCLSDADRGTAGVLMVHARKLPFGAVAKVRESVESQRGKVKSGWVVNALKDEIRERAA